MENSTLGHYCGWQNCCNVVIIKSGLERCPWQNKLEFVEGIKAYKYLMSELLLFRGFFSFDPLLTFLSSHKTDVLLFSTSPVGGLVLETGLRTDRNECDETAWHYKAILLRLRYKHPLPNSKFTKAVSIPQFKINRSKGSKGYLYVANTLLWGYYSGVDA